jgi:hypothetical protein
MDKQIELFRKAVEPLCGDAVSCVQSAILTGTPKFQGVTRHIHTRFTNTTMIVCGILILLPRSLEATTASKQ